VLSPGKRKKGGVKGRGCRTDSCMPGRKGFNTMTGLKKALYHTGKEPIVSQHEPKKPVLRVKGERDSSVLTTPEEYGTVRLTLTGKTLE